MKIFILGGAVCGRDHPNAVEETAKMQATCELLGASIASPRNEIVVCSPFDGSADTAVLKGIVAEPQGRDVSVEFHFVDSPEVRTRLDALVNNLQLRRVRKVPHPPPETDAPTARQFAWLVCQLSALESANITLAIGGESDGSANMLLLVAEGRRKMLLPFPILGGAAKRAFERRRYELEDRLGNKAAILHGLNSVGRAMELADEIMCPTNTPQVRQAKSSRFFVSYPRARQAEADQVETLLRRRNLAVFRDESDFGAGHELPGVIRQAVFESDVFIAIWCAEYACSPWCFDEFELALDRQVSHGLKLWVLRVDETRMVPTRARQLVYFDVRSRQELEGKLLHLINRESIIS
jgi:hypothetical protein